MSEAKTDRSIAPRGSHRRSKAKQTRDRNITVPARKVRTNKPKKGERVMEAQLAKAKVKKPLAVIDVPSPLDDVDPPADAWWTEEREKAFRMTLNGAAQHQVSVELSRSRHTVRRWMEDERFIDRLMEENASRFHASRQRRTMVALRLTDKVAKLADEALDEVASATGDAEYKARFRARDWLSEFREQNRMESEIYGLDKQRVDVNINGSVQHNHKHKGALDLSFKDFLLGSMKRMGIDVETEEVDAGRADEALVALTERALSEGNFLDELVERERLEQLEEANSR